MEADFDGAARSRRQQRRGAARGRWPLQLHHARLRGCAASARVMPPALRAAAALEQRVGLAAKARARARLRVLVICAQLAALEVDHARLAGRDIVRKVVQLHGAGELRHAATAGAPRRSARLSAARTLPPRSRSAVGGGARRCAALMRTRLAPGASSEGGGHAMCVGLWARIRSKRALAFASAPSERRCLRAAYQHDDKNTCCTAACFVAFQANSMIHRFVEKLQVFSYAFYYWQRNVCPARATVTAQQLSRPLRVPHGRARSPLGTRRPTRAAPRPAPRAPPRAAAPACRPASAKAQR